jgi:hypothetical protein
MTLQQFLRYIRSPGDAIVNSPELKGPLDSGVLKVVPAYYNLDTGAATTI